jgi:transcriptional regulator of acetoin/glycerol metabolism
MEMNIDEFKSAIASSHERCKLLKLNTDLLYSKKIINDKELQDKFAEKRKMILTAAPYMEQLINFVQGTNFFALLTDGEGCILNAIGDEKILSEAYQLKMIPGAYMNEESIGTNAMAVVIKTGKPVQLSGKDHYIEAYHKWTCSGAPIKDNQGNLIGVLDLTGYSEQVHPHTLGMVIAASNAIEEMIKVQEFHKLQNTNNKHIKTIFNYMPVAIVTSDIDGNIKIYNKKAVELLENGNHVLKKKNMRELIKDWEDIKESILSKDSIDKEESVINLYSNVSCQMTTNPIYNSIDNSVEIVYVFEEIKRIERQAYYTFDKIFGKDENFLKIVHYAKKIADSKSTILILGESGTGKEVFAQAIHNYSKRMDGPFIAINCGAIPKQLMELELFGYEEGAYVGAKRGGNPGKFEQADGGTILFDEIGELPLDMQIKLQRVLQEGIITRIGSEKSIPVNVRVIAATNKDLKKEVEMGRFRKDLFYRLNVLPLYLPPLRERKADVPILIQYFMKTICDNLGKKEVDIPKEYYKLMMNYNWPGNIRELENVVELIINTETIPPEYFTQETEDTDSLQEVENLDLDYIEKEHLLKVLHKNKGNISRAASDLGIGRNTLYNKMKKHEIQI